MIDTKIITDAILAVMPTAKVFINTNMNCYKISVIVWCNNKGYPQQAKLEMMLERELFDGDNDYIVDFITYQILKSIIFHEVINPPMAETEELLK